jgi:hypothetical protein
VTLLAVTPVGTSDIFGWTLARVIKTVLSVVTTAGTLLVAALVVRCGCGPHHWVYK